MNVKQLIDELSKYDREFDVGIVIWGKLFMIQDVDSNKKNVQLFSELSSCEFDRNDDYIANWATTEDGGEESE